MIATGTPAAWVLLFGAGIVVSLSASWLLVSRLERLGERAGFSEAWLGLLAALAADAPEITSAITALAGGQPAVGAGVVIGSNVFNLAALLGLAAVVAGGIAFHRRVVLLAGLPGIWVAVVCLPVAAGVVAPLTGLVLVAVILLPAVAVLGMRPARMERLPIPAAWARWLIAAVHEEEVELAEAVSPRRGGWRDGIAAMVALITVVGASIAMEHAATALGRRWAVADVITGGLVLAAVTSLPNAVTAVYLARRGRGAAVLSTALNSNTINVTIGLLVPASLTGLGSRSGPGTLVAAWYAGLTVLALGFAYRWRGLPRIPGLTIIAGYLVFVTALIVSVRQGGVRPQVAVVPAATIAVAGVLLALPRRRMLSAGRPREWHRPSVLPGWSNKRVLAVSLVMCSAVAACDAASGPHLILIGLLAGGPCWALLTARWPLTAVAAGFALGVGVVLGIPDQIFATATQYVFLAAVAAAGLAATIGAAILQRQRC